MTWISGKLWFAALLLLFFGQSFAIEHATDCPPEEVVFPCRCDKKFGKPQVECAGSRIYDLKKVFAKLETNLRRAAKHFYLLTISNSQIQSIEADTFGNVSFDEVVISGARQLTKIHSEAFRRMAPTLKRFAINRDMVSLDNHPSPYGIFDVLNSLTKARDILVTIPRLEAIPQEAFRLLGVDHISMGSFQKRGNLTTVGRKAFSGCNNITRISLHFNRLTSISDGAFEFDQPSNYSLTIDLQSNWLTGDSFASTAFAKLKRPATIGLAYNNLTYVNETVFKPFFDVEVTNKIIMTGNRVNCSDCRSFWLVKNWQDYKIKTKGMQCNADPKKDFYEHDWSRCGKVDSSVDSY